MDQMKNRSFQTYKISVFCYQKCKIKNYDVIACIVTFETVPKLFLLTFNAIIDILCLVGTNFCKTKISMKYKSYLESQQKSTHSNKKYEQVTTLLQSHFFVFIFAVNCAYEVVFILCFR